MYDICIRKDNYVCYIKLNNKIFSGFKIENNKIYSISNEDISIIKDININDFIKNSVDAILYDDDNKNIDKYNSPRMIKIKKYGQKILVITSLTTIILSLSTFANTYYISKTDTHLSSNIISYLYNNEYNVTLEMIKDAIYSSNIKDEYKDYLYNEDYLNSIIPYLNDNPNECYELINVRLKDMQIVDGGIAPEDSNWTGYYNPVYPNTITVYDMENKTDDEIKNIIAHEFIHMTSFSSEFDKNTLIEALTEILNHEYYCNDHYGKVIDYHYAYKDEVKVVMKLIELFGTKPFYEFLYNNDYSLLESDIANYLDNKDLSKFNDALKHYKLVSQQEYNDNNINTLNHYINDIYYDINNDYMANDDIMMGIEKGYITRFYFNKDKINQENSYIMEVDNTNYKPMLSFNLSLEEKFDKGLIYAYNPKEYKEISINEYNISNNYYLRNYHVIKDGNRVKLYKRITTLEEYRNNYEIVENKELIDLYNKNLGFNTCTLKEAIDNHIIVGGFAEDSFELPFSDYQKAYLLNPNKYIIGNYYPERDSVRVFIEINSYDEYLSYIKKGYTNFVWKEANGYSCMAYDDVFYFMRSSSVKLIFVKPFEDISEIKTL